MKKFLTTISTAVAASQFFAVKALAALNAPPTGMGGIKDTGGDSNSIKATIVELLVKVLDFITLLGVIFVVVAGIRLIVSGGDEGEKDKAKKTIIYVIIGIVVVLFARVIVQFFANL